MANIETENVINIITVEGGLPPEAAKEYNKMPTVTSHDGDYLGRDLAYIPGGQEPVFFGLGFLYGLSLDMIMQVIYTAEAEYRTSFTLTGGVIGIAIEILREKLFSFPVKGKKL